MEEPTQPRPADLPNGAAEPEVAVVGEEEKPPRSATAKAKAALGAEGSRPFTMRELLGELKEDGEAAAAASGSGGGVRLAFGEGNGIGYADAEGSSYRLVENWRCSP